MSEAFAQISAIYYMVEVGAAGQTGHVAIARRLDAIEDQSEWFASCMCLQAASTQVGFEVRRAGRF